MAANCVRAVRRKSWIVNGSRPCFTRPSATLSVSMPTCSYLQPVFDFSREPFFGQFRAVPEGRAGTAAVADSQVKAVAVRVDSDFTASQLRLYVHVRQPVSFLRHGCNLRGCWCSQQRCREPENAWLHDWLHCSTALSVDVR